MEIKSNLEINFHQQDEVSFFLENTNSGEDEKFGEILLFSTIILRTLVNLGNNQVSSSLAQLLAQVQGNLQNLMNHRGKEEPKIIDYSGNQGRKRFIISLKCVDNNFNFQYKAKGFGFLASGMGYYAPNSVLTLMKYLAKKRHNDKKYIEALENVASQCSGVYFSGKLGLTNQSQIAMMVAFASYEYDENK